MGMEDAVVDEERFAAAQKLIKVAALRGSPVDDGCCANCFYYLEPESELSYCWHEQFQTLVGANWWCHYWEMNDES